MRRTLLTGVATVLAALTCLAAPAGAADPDPLAPGPHPVDKIDYEAGNLLLTLVDGVTREPVPLRGSIIYPADAESAPIVVFDHGRHTACIGGPTPPDRICDDTTLPDGTPVETDVRSYAGYDYLSRNLASHGYAVMSVETNTANFDNDWRDGGADARSQIIQANLQLLYRWHKGAGPYVPGEPARTVGTKLTGKLDFANPIGLMGHSRGGDAVTDFVGYTRNLRPPTGFPRMNLGAVLALAPVNYTRWKMPYGVNYGVLLPACDGDVSTLQGGRFFENARYPDVVNGAADTFAKVQWYVQGTNHNFYNTVWVSDDFSNARDPACSRQVPGTARLTTRDQRRVGIALMNSFMRRYVGGETQFDPIMTGELTLPAAGEPVESGKGRGQTVKTSYVAPAARRLDVLRPTPIRDPQPDPGSPDPLDPPALFDGTLVTTTAQGGPLTTSGLATFQVCNPNDIAWRQGPTFPTPYPLCPQTADARGRPLKINRSIGNQFEVAWERPAAIDAGLGGARDVSGFGALHLRAGVNRDDPRNPQGDGQNPAAATQDFDVTLVDAAGRTATTNAAAWSTALQPSIGTVYKHVALNGIRIPLRAFDGVDLRAITAVGLGFGAPGRPATGSIQLADVLFQEDPRPVDPVVPGPDGPPSTPPGPVLGTPQQTGTATPARVCADAARPTVRLSSVALKARKLWVRGVAVDRGCAGARGPAKGGVQHTLVSLFRPVGGDRCRFVTAGGKLGRPRPCGRPLGVYAAGKARWSLGIPKARLPAGGYRLRVTTFDLSGNVSKAVVRRLRV